MHRLVILVLFVLLSTKSYAQDKVVSSDISVSDIKEHIKSERTVLRGKYKVDIPLKFKKESSIYATRYGNTKEVLNLNGLSLSGMDLRGTSFTMASMIKTDLSDADLSNADLVYVDLTGANLSNANLSKADFSNAVFDSTKLKGANFDGTNLFGAKFIKIGDLTQDEINNLKKRTNSYVDLEREPLPDYYKFDK
ncbi:MAG: pentapeptide repeat-containing protein [Rickettsiales bacterium]|nr:pentapeptide repeat-containing protein [Pseudomonadota bacterium]MDA0966284.1 pentapeptide repeat-containing protein [Pseudomonadota bacterium]MDG4543051.1 pentapeptide repeat-containing protein [Rickettsiales bacterium]MDG4545249.1 pentapeptide repeat-containing protein [Rickettsiales bacterium]MDG4547698.1 pentapeptide repeat-containing protein [Rickettsiales bacterium]